METIRLTKRVAEQLGCSRREAELYIEGGWVRLDGQMVDAPGLRVAPTQSIELASGARAEEVPPITLVLHKPVGFEAGLSSASGHAHAARSQGAPLALTLVRPETRYTESGPPVRVLGKHFQGLECFTPLPTEGCGLVVYTQDRRMARKLSEDIETLEQECIVEVAGEIAPGGLQKLCHGLSFNDRPLPPIKVSWQNERRLRFALKGIRPGQIPAMCEAVGLRVVSLKRIRIGQLPLSKLPEGQWRYLMPWEKF
jgi:23S rRNA pseudouridine2604 synthase